MKDNVTLDHNLEEYNKKYRNRRNKLHKISKEEVEAFDKANPSEIKNNLLKGRKWWLIGDTYYEIPKVFTLTWFSNLHIAVQISACSVGVIGIASAITFPILANTVWKSKRPTVNKHETKESLIYMYNSSSKEFAPYSQTEKMTYHFFNDSVIPYLDLADCLLGSSNGDSNGLPVEYTQEKNGFKIKINNPNVDTYLFINIDKQTLTYHHMTYYMESGSEDKYPFESFFKTGKYLFEGGTYSFEIIDEGVSDYKIDLTKYNMKIFEYNNKCYASNYLTYNAILPMMMNNSAPLFFNGSKAYYHNPSLSYIDGINALEEIRNGGDLYKNPEYLQYNYDILALVYDNFFGLDKRTSVFTGEEHIYFKDGAYNALEPFKEKLLSTEPNVTNNAMIEFYNKEVNDGGHSSYTCADIFTNTTEHTAYTGDYYELDKLYWEFWGKRNAKMYDPKQIDLDFDGCYTTNTDNDVAFITFDSFSNLSDHTLTSADLADNEYGKTTATLFGYANKKIRENNIKNVVLDLSCNGGGSGDAVMFIMSWLTGNGGTMTLKNPKDGTIIRVTGKADVNFDGVVDENDVIPNDVNVYAIISENTFSSANLLSVLLKEHTNTKFIGTRTGGGSCNASRFCGPLNVAPRISGLAQLGLNSSTKENYVTDEAGVIADFYKLTDVESFYDRDTIVSKIKGS